MTTPRRTWKIAGFAGTLSLCLVSMPGAPASDLELSTGPKGPPDITGSWTGTHKRPGAFGGPIDLNIVQSGLYYTFTGSADGDDYWTGVSLRGDFRLDVSGRKILYGVAWIAGNAVGDSSAILGGRVSKHGEAIKLEFVVLGNDVKATLHRPN